MINYFCFLSDLSKIKPLRIILKNHPKLEQNSYQTRGFYYGLAKIYSIDEFIISEDLESTIQQADLAITLCKSSLLTDLLYARVPSIIYELYDDGICSNFDDFNDIFPIVSSSEDLYLTLKRHMCLQAHGNYRKKLANIHQKFDLRLRSVDEKCHKLIDFLA